MKLACPTCAALYNVPDSMIGEGRMMQCARCAHEWFARPLPAEAPLPASAPEAGPPAPEAGTPAPEVAPALPAPPAPIALAPPSRIGEVPPSPEPGSLLGQLPLRLAWAASLGLVVWGGYFAWTERARMAELWPPIAKLYRLFGA
jgi:predicted Zn finger-like uncharacterized protein